MRIREHAAKGLADAIAARVVLGAPPTLVHAPPSQLAEHPTVAIHLETAKLEYSEDEDLEVDDDGELIAGATATDDAGELVRGDVAELAPGVTLSRCGTIRCAGRIWVGSRYPAKRTEVEEEVFHAFHADRAAPGSILVPLAGAQVGAHTIPFGVGSADLRDSTWELEKTFGERLWAFLRFELDVPLLVPRRDPIAQQMLLAVTTDLATPIAEPADLADLTSLETFTVTE